MKNYRIQIFILAIWFLACFLAQMLNAQPVNRWVRFYDGHNEYDAFFDVFSTAEGGYAMVGVSNLNRQRDGFWLVVTDSDGGEIWQRTYTDERFPGLGNWGYTLIQDDDGGFLLGGRARDENRVFHFSVLRTDAEGERLWWRTYGEADWSACYAVIELKSGEFVAAGVTQQLDAYAVMINGDGDPLWGHTYPGVEFKALRETQGGLLFAGAQDVWSNWLLKTDFEGEILWSRTYGEGVLNSLVSCRDGGFAAGGHYLVDEAADWSLLKVNDEGQELWIRSFDFDDNDWCRCLTQMWDGGFTLIGKAGPGYTNPAVLRTDSPGNEIWRRLDHNRVEDRGSDEYNSTIVGPDNMVLIAGSAYGGGEQRIIDGMLVKIVPDRSAPTIWEYIPEELDFSTLLGDSIFFAIVEAEDAQNDSLLFTWTFDEDTVSTDTSRTITFDALNDHIVECFVSDGDQADSVAWLVHVEDFFIRSFEPDSLELTIQRGTEVDFGIDVAALENLDVENTWTLTQRNQQQEELGGGDNVSVRFVQSGRHQLQALVSHEDQSDEVTWIVNVRSSVYSWWPSELELSAYKDSTLEFVITPFNEDSDSLEYVWLLDGEPVGSDSASVFVTFPEVGQSELTSIVHDGIEGDTISWTVDVQEWNFTTDYTDLTDFPTSPVLFPASPNPFNSSVKLSMYLPKVDHVSLSIFDVNGREVSRLIDGDVGAGNQTFVWNASDFPAGVYVVRMEAGDALEMRKVVLVR